MRKLRCLHEVVGREEPPDDGVVQAPVHVDDVELGVVLVARETAGGEGKGRCVGGLKVHGGWGEMGGRK